jgi:hypothetical protein
MPLSVLALSLGLFAAFTLPAHAMRSTDTAPAPAEQSAAVGEEPRIAGFFMSE